MSIIRTTIENLEGFCPFDIPDYPSGFYFRIDLTAASACEDDLKDVVFTPIGDYVILEGDRVFTYSEFWEFTELSKFKLGDLLDYEEAVRQFENRIAWREFIISPCCNG